MPAAKKTSPLARTAANKVPAKKAATAKKTAVKTTARPPLASKTVQVTSPLSSLPAANQLEYFSQLLQEIYDAAIDPARWEACLNTVASIVQANNASLIVRHGSSDGLGTIVTGAGKNRRGSGANPFYMSSPFIGLPLNQIVTIGDFLSDADWRASQFYTEWCKPHQVYHMMAVDFMTEGRGIYGLRFTRPEGQEPFNLADKRLTQMLVPHLQRALALTQGINQGRQIGQLYSQAMSQLMVSTIILDHKGNVLQANATAQKALDAADGLRVLGGQLVANVSADNKKLQRMVADVLAGGEEETPGVVEALSVTRGPGKAPWGLVVRAVPAGAWIDGKGVPAVAVFVRDPDGNPHPPAKLAQQLFALTPAETALATQLANGLSLEESAVALGIRHNTARAHLRSIFSKTGARRQTELVRMFLNSVMPLGVVPEPSSAE
jgi:DNA-binding CsgD family transcriptional regulator